ncbi:MBG domain-containing protein, partial [Flavobacterium sp.]|uniref:MBG domain-containing protein n=1 Tax=Flavobacterium sp. TaxID=239 RepID=UPI002FD89068
MINLLLFRKSKWLLFLCFVLLLVSTSHVTWSQINISNTSTITQNFDGMNANTTAPSNWRVQQSASPTWAGGTSTLGAQASSGAPTTGTTYNWGAGVSDRAIGVMTSGGYASPNSVMAFFSNTNANNLTSVTISYDLERYRINTAAASVAFFYSTNGSTWVSVPAGDISSSSLPTGASSYSFSPSGIPSTTNAGVISKTGISITGLSIPNGGNFYLRWNLVTTGSNSQGIGIDNFSLAATFAPSCTSQTLTALTTPLTKTFGDAPYSVATTASSGLTVTYSSNNSSVATVDSSGNVTILGAGTATITASQAGDATYCAATSVTQVLTVNKATPIISGTGTATNITFGQTLASSTIGGFTSSTPGTFAFTSPSTAPNAGTASYGVTFTPTDLANYNTVTTTVSVTVNKANSSISVTGSNSYTYNGLPQGPNTVSQTGSNGAITYSYTGVSYGPTALLPSQAGTYQVVATVAEDANFNGASSAAYAFTISQVLLTVTADDQVAIENTTLPSFTVSYSGFVNNETEADLIEEPTASSPTADLATPGTYPIVVSGGSAANYTFSYVPGTLTITSASSPLCPFSTALADATPQTVCQDLAATVLTAVITNAGVVGTPTYQYQWYYNTTDSNTVAGATAISGATASTYIPETTASAVGTRYYFVVGYATDNDCGQTATTQTLASSTVAVTVLATPEATITPSGATSFCSGGSVTLTASPAASYLWSTG